MTKIRLASDGVDLAQATPLPANEMRPSYGGPQRDAINSVIDGIVGDICKDIADVRHILDDLEQHILEGAASAKHHLSEQVGMCVSVKDEVTHMRRVVFDIEAREKAARDAHAG
jgi:hypothetical protein